MLGQLIRFVLVGALLFLFGCARTIRPPIPYQIPPDLQSSLIKVVVTLKSGFSGQLTLLTTSGYTIAIRKDMITGKLVKWEDGKVSIQTRIWVEGHFREGYFTGLPTGGSYFTGICTIPIEHIKKMTIADRGQKLPDWLVTCLKVLGGCLAMGAGIPST